MWDGAVYDGSFAEGTFHGRGIKKEAKTGKILQRGTWRMGRFAMAATPTKIVQEQPPVVEQNGSNDSPSEKKMDETSSPVVDVDEVVPVSPGLEQEPSGDSGDSVGGRRLSVKSPTLDGSISGSMSELALDDDEDANARSETRVSTGGGAGVVQELDLTGDGEENETKPPHYAASSEQAVVMAQPEVLDDDDLPAPVVEQ